MFLGMSRFLSISTLKMLSSVVEFLFFLMFCESVVSPFSMVLIQILRLTSGQLCPALLLLVAGYCCCLFGDGRVFHFSSVIYINKYNKKHVNCK